VVGDVVRVVIVTANMAGTAADVVEESLGTN
jgi:hypothetical protein